MNRDTLDRFLERGILGLITAMLVFAPLAMGAVGTMEFLVVQALMMTVMFLWAVRLAIKPKMRFFCPPIGWAVLAFAVYVLMRYFTANIEYIARLEMIQTLVYAFLFFAIINNLTSRESTQVIVFTLFFVGAAISCYALWQFLTRSSRVWNLWSPYTGRASGTYISPNNFACFMEMLLPLALAYFLVGRAKALTRVLLGYAVLAMAAGLAVSFSRGGWCAAAIGVVAVLAVLFSQRQHRLPAFLVLVVFLCGGLFFVTKYLSRTISYVVRVESVQRGDSVEMGFRREMWVAAERMWEDHFWFGVGPGLYDYRFGQYRPEKVQARPDRAHNDYLNLLADWGTTGGIIVLGGMIFFVTSQAKIWGVVRPNDLGRGMSNRFAFFIGASGSLLALAAHSFVDFNLHIPANAMIGLSLLALLTAQLRLATEKYRFELKPPARSMVLVLLAGGIVYFGFQGLRLGEEFALRVRAENPDMPLPERAEYLKKALAIEPKDFRVTYDLGELYRVQSFQGDSDYQSLAQTAMQWYAKGMKLDPFSSDNYLRYGMCLDWLDQPDQAEPYYRQAEALDPNNYYDMSNIGWHYIQTGDYAAARVCFQRSIRLGLDVNDISNSYWDIVQKKLVEGASGQAFLPGGF